MSKENHGKIPRGQFVTNYNNERLENSLTFSEGKCPLKILGVNYMEIKNCAIDKILSWK